MTRIYDVAIIGGGPAGLSAAITAGSELANVILIDSGKKITADKPNIPFLGGQIRETARIENHPGVISASGKEFVATLVEQAKRMGVEIRCPEHAESLCMISDDLKEITTRSGDTIVARAVVLANGLKWRHLSSDTGAESYLGYGFNYGAMDVNANEYGVCNIGIIGAGNSAGQAVMSLATNPLANIKIYIRGAKPPSATMSKYLVDRIEVEDRITVVQDVEVIEMLGKRALDHVRLRCGDGSEYIDNCEHLFAFIGAVPKNDWVPREIARNPRGYILTGTDLGLTAGYKPYDHETSMSGVFAAGDVLDSPFKRVTIATGHGSTVIAAIHRYLDDLCTGERKPTQVRVHA